MLYNIPNEEWQPLRLCPSLHILLLMNAGNLGSAWKTVN